MVGVTDLDVRPSNRFGQPAPPTSPRPRPAWPAVVLALPWAGVGTATLIAGALPSLQPRSTLLAKFASFIDWGLPFWVAATLLLAVGWLIARRAALLPWLLVSLLGLGIQASWVLPYTVSNSRPMAAEQSLRVATLNMEVGGADREQIIALARQADVLALVEITPEAIVELRAAGLEEVMPHRVGEGVEAVSGTAVYSRTPIEQVADLGTSMQSTLTRVSTADGTEVLVAAVHPVNPYSGGAGWAADASRLRAGLHPHLTENLVVTGDFNAVRGHLTMQRLHGDGLSDAADLAGAGPPRTWPLRDLPFPVIAIDHTLVSPTMTARDFSVQRVANTDHAGLLVTVGVAAG